MSYLYRRMLAALTGAVAAFLVFGVTFAAAPPISAEDERPASDIHQFVDKITNEEIKHLLAHMDEATVEEIKEILVEDSNNDIIYAYLQVHPEFENFIREYINNKNN